MPRQTSVYDELIVDCFAGGGGASTGIELAIGRPVDIAINHDPAAVEMHMANHPYTRHYCENVWEAPPREVVNGKHVGLLWLSPDCTHHSKARGGKPRKKEIRGLAWVAVRWAATVRPRVIVLENVEEFATWGPLDKAGQPIKAKSGNTFNSFVNALRNLGYAVDWRELRACDYGAPTIRKRLFLIARCDGRKIVYPEPTHGAPDSEAVKVGRLKPYRSAAEIIDWSLPCPSIFETSEEIKEKYGLKAIRPLADNTLRRIARGIKKFVIDNPNPYIVDFKHDNASQSVGEPMRTITGVNGFAVVSPCIAQGHVKHGKDEFADINTPMKTLLTRPEWMLVAPTLAQYHNEKSESEVRGQSVEKPLLTVDTENRYGIVTSHLTILRKNSDGQDLRNPIKTITASPGHFGEVRALLIKYYGTGDGQDIKDPLHTVTAKDRIGLVTIKGETYAIADIGLRMLTPRELFNAQGFPPDYIIDTGVLGKPISKSDQVARCGNAVPPPFAEAIVRANLPEMCGKRIETMAGLMEEIAG